MKNTTKEETKEVIKAKLSLMDALNDILNSLPEDISKALENIFSSYKLSESQRLEAAKNEADLVQWKEASFAKNAPLYKRQDGRERDEYINDMRAYMKSLRESETDYADFNPRKRINAKTKAVIEDKPIVLGKCPCPVDGEKTRCCKLTTLDAAMQCAFACSYCSVQAFYNENKILVAGNLEKRLDEIELPENVWHIGTGQASDSLLLGDDYGTLTALSSFASKHRDVIIELKSKSKRDVFDRKYPRNMIFTWSLNAETITEKEEHLTATLDERLQTARKAADNGSLVGFHIHPMVYFKGWQDEYSKVVNKIMSMFRPEEVLMISIGTLTFTKAVIKRLREKEAESRVLEMELEKTAGKYSYPLEKKARMFSHVYSSFSEEWHDNVFFYLCMEDPALWPIVLKREYKCDKDFEEDMKRRYFHKVNS